MESTSRRFADIKKTFYRVNVMQSPNNQMINWCKQHMSTGVYTYANRAPDNIPEFWFELDKDAMLFKLMFA